MGQFRSFYTSTTDLYLLSNKINVFDDTYYCERYYRDIRRIFSHFHKDMVNRVRPYSF